MADSPSGNIPLYPPNSRVKATFQLPRTELELLQNMAEEDMTSVTSALRRVIRSEKTLRELSERGRILLIGPDGHVKELVRD